MSGCLRLQGALIHLIGFGKPFTALHARCEGGEPQEDIIKVSLTVREGGRNDR